MLYNLQKKFLEKYIYHVILVSLKNFISHLCAVLDSLTFFGNRGRNCKYFYAFFSFSKTSSNIAYIHKKFKSAPWKLIALFALAKDFSKTKLSKIKQKCTWRFLLQFVVTEWMSFQKKNFFYKTFSYVYRLQVLLMRFCHNDIFWVSRL